MLEKCKSPQWKSTYHELCALFEAYSNVINLSFIGFPDNWKYVLKPNDIDMSPDDTVKKASDEKVLNASKHLMERNLDVYSELSK